MMARQVARQFCRLGAVHSLVYGRRARGENGRKLTASTRVGSESRLMDYLGLIVQLYLSPIGKALGIRKMQSWVNPQAAQ